MGAPRIVGLKTMHIALRRLELDNGAIVVLTQKGNQFSTQKLSPNTEIFRMEDKSGGSGGGGGTKVLLTVGVFAGAGAAAYYYWNANERDPFTWVNDQLPITKKKTEPKSAVTETGGLKIKNNTNQVMAANEKSGEKTLVLRSVRESKVRSDPEPQARVTPGTSVKSEQVTRKDTQEKETSGDALVSQSVDSQKSDKTTSDNSKLPDSSAAIAGLANPQK